MFAHIARNLSEEVVVNVAEIDKSAVELYGGWKHFRKWYTREARPFIEVQGLAGAIPFEDLYNGTRLKGAEGLVAFVPNPEHRGWFIPVAYFNYWTGPCVPDYLHDLAATVAAGRPVDRPFAVSDTAVSLRHAPPGLYRSLIAHAILEYWEKAYTQYGITEVYNVVRLAPNANRARGAHLCVGWEDARDESGDPLVMIKAGLTDVLGNLVEGRYQVLKLDIGSPQMAGHLRRAVERMRANGIVTLDLDGRDDTFRALHRAATDDFCGDVQIPRPRLDDDSTGR